MEHKQDYDARSPTDINKAAIEAMERECEDAGILSRQNDEAISSLDARIEAMEKRLNGDEIDFTFSMKPPERFKPITAGAHGDFVLAPDQVHIGKSPSGDSDKWNAVMKALEELYEMYYKKPDNGAEVEISLSSLMQAYDNWLD
jgi:hypothetical protein